MLRGRGKELKLLAVSLMLCLLLMIAALEVYFQKKYWQHTTFQFDPELGWVAAASHSIATNGKTYTTNAAGFRSPEVNADAEHILVAGDSVTWGLGVGDRETVTHYLQEKSEPSQVLNLGVSGYGIDQDYLLLQRHLPKLNPKAVVVIICAANDGADTAQNERYGKSKPLFTVSETARQNIPPATGGKTGWQNIPQSIIAASGDMITLTNSPVAANSCANLISRSKVLSLPALENLRNGVCPKTVLNDLDKNIVLASLLLKISKLAHEKKSRLLFVLSPSKNDFKYFDRLAEFASSKDRGKYDRAIYNTVELIAFKKLFAEMRLPYLDYFDFLRSQKLDVEPLYQDNEHYSPLGNQMLATAIFDRLNITAPLSGG